MCTWPVGLFYSDYLRLKTPVCSLACCCCCHPCCSTQQQQQQDGRQQDEPTKNPTSISDATSSQPCALPSTFRFQNKHKALNKRCKNILLLALVELLVFSLLFLTARDLSHLQVQQQGIGAIALSTAPKVGNLFVQYWARFSVLSAKIPRLTFNFHEK